jgi:hypothetical protein
VTAFVIVHQVPVSMNDPGRLAPSRFIEGGHRSCEKSLVMLTHAKKQNGQNSCDLTKVIGAMGKNGYQRTVFRIRVGHCRFSFIDAAWP